MTCGSVCASRTRPPLPYMYSRATVCGHLYKKKSSLSVFVVSNALFAYVLFFCSGFPFPSILSWLKKKWLPPANEFHINRIQALSKSNSSAVVYHKSAELCHCCKHVSQCRCLLSS